MKNAPITLYDYWRSSASYRVRIALNIKGLSYDKVSVNLLTGEHKSAEFATINPQGYVPAVHMDNVLLTQSVPIIEYINDMYPEPNLLGDTPQHSAIIRQLSAIIACDIHPVCNMNVAQRIAQMTGNDNQKVPWMQHYITAGLESLEKVMINTAGDYSVGDRLSIVDCCLIPQIYNANRWGADIAQLGTINRVYQNCITQSAFIEAEPRET